MATKSNKRLAKGLLENLEFRAHRGPTVQGSEIQSAREFLRNHDFPPSSEYFARLADIENRLGQRTPQPPATATKRNYGGEAAGYRMQLQCIYDHLILSTCYDGAFHTQRGRIKVSHRFNRAGRIDFVELKFLNSLHHVLNGQLRKLLLIKGYDSLRRDWHSAEAFLLPTLPQELVFLYEDIFRCERGDLFAWLVNIGHGLLDDLIADLRSSANSHGRNGVRPTNGHSEAILSSCAERLDSSQLSVLNSEPSDSQSPATCVVAPPPPVTGTRPGSEQLPLGAVLDDPLALELLSAAATLQSTVEILDPRHAIVHYVRQ